MTDKKWQPRPAARYQSPDARHSEPRGKPAPRGLIVPRGLPVKRATIRTARSWRKEQQRGLAIAVSLTLALGALLVGYAVQAQIAGEADRTARRAEQIALATKEDLKKGAVLFVPVYGNVCRQRWIDNATWTIRNGADVICDEAASWTVNTKPTDQSVAQRMDAVRGGFRVTAKPAD
jgi:hypothetical protein